MSRQGGGGLREPPDSGKAIIFSGKSYIFRAEANSQK